MGSGRRGRGRQHGFLLSPFRFAGSLWTAANLNAPPALWCNDASAVTGTTTASQWSDISGSGHHLTQATSGAQPTIVASGLSGRRTLQFDGATDLMRFSAPSFAGVGQGWMAAVVKRTALDGTFVGRQLAYVPVNSTAGNTRLGLVLASGGVANRLGSVARRLDADSAAGTLNGATIADTGWHIVLLAQDWANGDGYLYSDGGSAASNTSMTSEGSTSATAPASSGCVGAALNGSGVAISFANMELAELLMGSGSLPSAGEVERLFGWLAHKWGLTALLPSDHPYKSFAPTL